MNPTAPAQRLARQITKVVGPCYQDDSRLTDVAMLIDAAIQEATNKAVTASNTWRDDFYKMVVERDQLRADLAAAYEREKVLREGAMRDAALRTVAAELEHAVREMLSFISIVHPGEEDDIETMAQIEKTEGMATAALASYARLQNRVKVIQDTGIAGAPKFYVGGSLPTSHNETH